MRVSGMFSAAKIRNGSTYLGRHLTSNDYYTEGEQVDGKWIGAGAELMGLGEPIKAGDASFESIRQGYHPENGEPLTASGTLREDRLAFIDFQLSAPKSVSIMGMLYDEDRIKTAHEKAAQIAFYKLEQFSARQVSGNGNSHGTELTGNLVAAQFNHDASRSLDPQVHTHFVVANATYDEETGKWHSLTEAEIFKNIKYAGRVYQNELARELNRLGYETETRQSRGRYESFEIAGISDEVKRTFSKRREEIDAAIHQFEQENGRKPSTAEISVITKETRNDKLTEITTPEVREAQREHLENIKNHGLDEIYQNAVERDVAVMNEEALKERIAEQVEHVEERESVFAAEKDVFAQILAENAGQVDEDSLQNAWDNYALENLVEANPSEARKQTIYSTKENAAREENILNVVNQGVGIYETMGDTEAVVLETTEFLNDGQKQALNDILSSEDQVSILRGAAGTGKSTLLSAISDGIEEKQTFLAPLGKQVEGLRQDGEEAGNDAMSKAATVASFLQKENKPGGVWVIDEAGMLSTKQMDSLLSAAQDSNARVILSGDYKQHSSVEAGDAMRLIKENSKTKSAELTQVMRQKDTGYREATEMMAKGEIRSGTEALDRLGFVHEGADYLDQGVQQYLQKYEAGEARQTVFMAPTHRELGEANERIRSELQQRGHLGEESTQRDTLKAYNYTKAQTGSAKNYNVGDGVRLDATIAGNGRDVRPGLYDIEKVDGKHHRLEMRNRETGNKAVVRPSELKGKAEVGEIDQIDVNKGDRLLITENDKKMGLKRGQTATVTGISKKGSPQIQVDGKPKSMTVRKDFTGMTYGYGVTDYRAQSMSVKNAIVVADSMKAASKYVAATRGKEGLSVHVPDKQRFLYQSGDRVQVGDDKKEATIMGLDDKGQFKARFDGEKQAVSLPSDSKIQATNFRETDEKRTNLTDLKKQDSNLSVSQGGAHSRAGKKGQQKQDRQEVVRKRTIRKEVEKTSTKDKSEEVNRDEGMKL